MVLQGMRMKWNTTCSSRTQLFQPCSVLFPAHNNFFWGNEWSSDQSFKRSGSCAANSWCLSSRFTSVLHQSLRIWTGKQTASTRPRSESLGSGLQRLGDSALSTWQACQVVIQFKHCTVVFSVLKILPKKESIINLISIHPKMSHLDVCPITYSRLNYNNIKPNGLG